MKELVVVLIFLYGFPGVGKLTVARELAELTGFRVFHNHLTVDLLLAVFDFGTPQFVELRDHIWLTTMNEAAKSGASGLIFTFAPENTVPLDFVDRLKDQLNRAGSDIFFVKIQCSDAALKQRISDPSRNSYHKLKNFEIFETQRQSGNYDCLDFPEPALTLDTSTLTPLQTAEKIKLTLSNWKDAQHRQNSSL